MTKKTKRKLHFTVVSRVLLVMGLILLGASLLWMQKQSVSIQQVSETTLPNVITKKVLVLNYNPVIEARDNQLLTTTMGWNDPAILEQEYIDAVKEVSHGIVDYQIIERINLDEYPIKVNDYQFNDDIYLDCRQNPATCNNEFANYNAILTKYQVCEKLNAGQIDELWLWGGPHFGYHEANMAGLGAFPTTGQVVQNTTCQRQLNIMGFNYERDVLEMIHDIGHRIEGTMRQVSTATNTNIWSKFIKYELINPNESSCGTVHFPPNGIKAYDWSNVNPVSNNCEDWLNYPNLTGKKEIFACNQWGCSYWEKYWLSHLPYSNGSMDGVRNNWWSYIVDYEKAITQIQDGPQYFTIKNGSSDKNSSCGPVATNKNEVYFGINETCTPSKPYTATFDFTGVQIPRGANITKAHMTVIEDGPYENILNLAVNLQSSIVITPKIDWKITEPWVSMTPTDTPDITSLLQQVVSHPAWRSGNTITLNVTYKSGIGHRRIFAYERYSLAAPKLVVEYDTPTPPSPSPSISPSPTPSYASCVYNCVVNEHKSLTVCRKQCL